MANELGNSTFNGAVAFGSGGVECADLSLGFSAGTLGCTPGCTYDLSTCEGGLVTCGDSVIDTRITSATTWSPRHRGW